MAAFVIGQMQIHNRDWMEEYFEKIPALVAQHEGRFLVRGGDPERLEGESEIPDVVFVLAFPDKEHARKFWDSDAFQTLAVLRRSGSSLNSLLVDTLT